MPGPRSCGLTEMKSGIPTRSRLVTAVTFVTPIASSTARARRMVALGATERSTPAVEYFNSFCANQNSYVQLGKFMGLSLFQAGYGNCVPATLHSECCPILFGGARWRDSRDATASEDARTPARDARQ